MSAVRQEQTNKQEKTALAEVRPQPVARPLIFIDIETTGLDPLRHDIIEVAAMRVDPVSLGVEAVFESRVRPTSTTPADASAVELNGFQAEEWDDAPLLEEVLVSLRGFLEGGLLIGHNPTFDWTFLLTAYRTLGVRPPKVDHHLIDTVSLAWPLLRQGMVRSLSLLELCKHYGIPNQGAHHALEDVVRTYQVLLRLVRAEHPGNAEVAAAGGIQ